MSILIAALHWEIRCLDKGEKFSNRNTKEHYLNLSRYEGQQRRKFHRTGEKPERRDKTPARPQSSTATTSATSTSLTSTPRTTLTGPEITGNGSRLCVITFEFHDRNITCRELREREGGWHGLGVAVLEAAGRAADDGLALPDVQGGGVAVRRGRLLGRGRPQPHPTVRHLQPQAQAGVLLQASLKTSKHFVYAMRGVLSEDMNTYMKPTSMDN